MANLNFKRGAYEDLEILSNNSQIEDGTFYWTEDEHRLYIGVKSVGTDDVLLIEITDAVKADLLQLFGSDLDLLESAVKNNAISNIKITEKNDGTGLVNLEYDYWSGDNETLSYNLNEKVLINDQPEGTVAYLTGTIVSDGGKANSLIKNNKVYLGSEDGSLHATSFVGNLKGVAEQATLATTATTATHATSATQDILKNNITDHYFHSAEISEAATEDASYRINFISGAGSIIDFIDIVDNDTTYEQATSSELGLVKIGYNGTTEKTYPVLLNEAGQMYVNVPWTDTILEDTNTLYTFTQEGLNLRVNSTDGAYDDEIVYQGQDTTYDIANAVEAGLVKIGYVENGKNYPVELSEGKMFVNVPWENTYVDTTYDFSQTGKDLYLTSTDGEYDNVKIYTGSTHLPNPNKLAISADGTSIVDYDGSGSGALHLHSGSNITLTKDGNNLTIASSYVNTDTTYALEGGVTEDGAEVILTGSDGNEDVVSIGAAGENTFGLIKTGYAAEGRNYSVEVDSSGNAFVNVPWTDTLDGNTQYEIGGANDSAGYKIELNGNYGEYSEAIIPTATDDSFGVVKTGYITDNANHNYAFDVDENGKGYVNIPFDASLSTTSSKPLANKTIATAINTINENFSGLQTTVGNLAVDIEETATKLAEAFNGADISVDQHTLSFSHGENVLDSLGINNATTNLDGYMSKEDKIKLDGIESGANKTVVDNALDGASINPVQNKIVYNRINQVEDNSIVGISVSGTTITYSKGDGSTRSIITQDTDTTYTAGSKLELDGTTFNHEESTAAAGSYGSATTASSWGESITFPAITIDDYGHITGVSTGTVTIPDNPNVDTKNTTGATEKADTKLYLVGAESQTANPVTYSNADVYIDINNKLNATNGFAGNLTGNADSATKAIQDGGGNVITTSYATTLDETRDADSYDLTLKSKDGTTLDSTSLGVATASLAGLMAPAQVTKLSGIEAGANKTIIDSSLSTTSTNPVENKIVATNINNLTADIENLAAEVEETYVTSVGYNSSTNQLTYTKNGTANNVVKLAALDSNNKIPLSYIPEGAVSKLVTVANNSALLALTSADVQNGDSVVVTSDNTMYYVSDDTKLGSMSAFTEYSAGIAEKALIDGSNNNIDDAFHDAALTTNTDTQKVITFTRSNGETQTVTINGKFTDNNTTYTAGAKLDLNGTTFDHETSGVAAGSYGDADQVSGWNSTIKVPSITVDTYGHITGIAEGSITLPSNPNTDTKNTAGATNTSSKIFLVGATSQAANPQTYTHDTAYVGTDGLLYSGSKKVAVVEDLEDYAPKTQGVFYIEGDSGGTAGQWTGTHNDIEALYDGLTIAYYIQTVGASGGTTLKLNSFEAKPVYRYGTSKATTHYPVDSLILLVYSAEKGAWYATDYDSDTRNTAGSTNKTNAKLFLVGAESQAANPVTYSNSGVYINADNQLVSTGGFEGNLTGNAQTATTATTALRDDSGNEINQAFYDIDIELSDDKVQKTIVLTRGDSTTNSITFSDVAYFGSDGIQVNNQTISHTNSVSAATNVGADGDSRTLTWGDSFNSPCFSYDAQGHITGSVIATYTLPENPDTNTTYSAGTGLSLSGTTFNHSNSAEGGASRKGPSQDATLTWGDSFTGIEVQYDAQGHIKIANERTFTLPSNPNTDTKNTAGATNSSNKLYLIGATAQNAEVQTYSHDTAYIGTDGLLYSGNALVATQNYVVNQISDSLSAINVDNTIKFDTFNINDNYEVNVVSAAGATKDPVIKTKDTYINSISVVNGSTAGPTLKFSYFTSRGTAPETLNTVLPSASNTISGVVTTGTQTFAGQKIFANTTDSTSSVSQASINTAGGISVAKQVSMNKARIGDAVTLQYNATDGCLEFVFA